MAKNAFGPKWSINDANYLAPKALGEIVGISFSPTLEGEEGAGPEGSYLLLLIFCSNACLPPPPPRRKLSPNDGVTPSQLPMHHNPNLTFGLCLHYRLTIGRQG